LITGGVVLAITVGIAMQYIPSNLLADSFKHLDPGEYAFYGAEAHR
jgi:hypothetical protein